MIRENEEVYDTEIAPLMQQIIDICQENEIPITASFQIGDGFFCTTVISQEGEDPRMWVAGQILKTGQAMYAITARSVA